MICGVFSKVLLKSLSPASLFRLSEQQRRIGAAEAEGIGERQIDLALARLMRHQIDGRLDRSTAETLAALLGGLAAK